MASDASFGNNPADGHRDHFAASMLNSDPSPISANSTTNLLSQQQQQHPYANSEYSPNPGGYYPGGGPLAPVAEAMETSTDVDPRASAQGPFGDPAFAGKTFVVKNAFKPTLEDEMEMKLGEHVEILLSYDDGWALGRNQAGAQGVFPRDCVEEAPSARVPTPTPNVDLPFMANGNNNNGAGLQRAPTLPKLDMGRSSPISFHQQQSSQGHIPSEQAPQISQALPSPLNFPPYIQVSSPTQDSEDAGSPHPASSYYMSSSPGQIIDEFPGTPSGPRGPPASPSKPKRTSSIIGGKDAELFRALGDTLDRDSVHEHDDLL